MKKVLEIIAYIPLPCHSRKIEATLHLVIKLLRCLDIEGLSKFKWFEKKPPVLPYLATHQSDSQSDSLTMYGW